MDNSILDHEKCSRSFRLDPKQQWNSSASRCSLHQCHLHVSDTQVYGHQLCSLRQQGLPDVSAESSDFLSLSSSSDLRGNLFGFLWISAFVFGHWTFAERHQNRLLQGNCWEIPKDCAYHDGGHCFYNLDTPAGRLGPLLCRYCRWRSTLSLKLVAKLPPDPQLVRDKRHLLASNASHCDRLCSLLCVDVSHCLRVQTPLERLLDGWTHEFCVDGGEVLHRLCEQPCRLSQQRNLVSKHHLDLMKSLKAVHFSLTSLIQSADILYFIPPYRFTTFGMGIFIGLILRTQKNVKWSSFQMALGHISALVCLFITGVLMTINLEYDRVYQGLFTALSSVTWSWVFGWLILASHFGSHSECNWRFQSHTADRCLPQIF